MVKLSNSKAFQLEVLGLLLRDSLFAGRFYGIFSIDPDLQSLNMKIFSDDYINTIIRKCYSLNKSGTYLSEGIILNEIERDNNISIDDKIEIEKIIQKAYSIQLGPSQKYEKELLEQIQITKTYSFVKNVGQYLLSENPKDILEFKKKASLFVETLNKLKLSTDNEIILSNLPSLIDEYATDSFSNIPLGIKEIDEELNGGGSFGGIARGELTIFLSGVNDGKSLSMLSFEANAIANGFKGIHINLEGKRLQPVMRLISNMAKISYKRLTAHYKEARVRNSQTFEKFFTEEERKRIAESEEKVKNLRVFHEIKDCDIVNIESVIREAHFEDRIDFVCIDYGMLVTANGAFASREQMLAFVFRRLEILASELGIAIVSPMQVNRSGLLELRADAKSGNLRPVYTMDHVSDVKKAVDTAGTVIGYSRTQDERRMGMGRFHIIKQREGITGLQVGIHSSFDTCSIFDGERYYIGMGDDAVKPKTTDISHINKIAKAQGDYEENTLDLLEGFLKLISDIKQIDIDVISAEVGNLPPGVECSADEYIIQLKEMKNTLLDEINIIRTQNVHQINEMQKVLLDGSLLKKSGGKNATDKRIIELTEKGKILNAMDYLGNRNAYKKAS